MQNIKIKTLIDQGTTILDPNSVFIDPSVNLDLISPDITIYPGCRISGEKTSIGPSCILGEEAPATIKDCQLAENVKLKGGFFSGATFMSGAELCSGAHVRPGTLLEEQASCAHTVGLKQTVLLPFVTLGSLINFCDCLMSGGTDKKNHSEVGSSYIHFNYTPHQDKATPSLIGDVPRGVMMKEKPIFLGGQGGLVGPCRVAYGTIVAAGTILRKDVCEEGCLVHDRPARKHSQHPYNSSIHGNIHRILINNFVYIGNLHALLQWHTSVRSQFMTKTPYLKACAEGAVNQIKLMIKERVKRLSQLKNNLEKSLEFIRSKSGADLSVSPYTEQQAFIEKWPELESRLETDNATNADIKAQDTFLNKLNSNMSYIEAIKALDPDAKQSGTTWLQSIVDSVTALI
ncbi:hypothetical protein ACFLS1_01260 [Verrucomicrobiota bacterium]